MILDTNILIEILGGDDKLQQSLEKLNEKVTTTAINRYELLKAPKEDDAISLLNNFEIYDLDYKSADKASLMYKQLKKKGRLVNEFDILIASIAITHDELLVTRDKDFQEIAKIAPLKFIAI